MTKNEWLALEDPAPMLDWICATAPEKKLREFACACCRRIWERFAPDWGRRVFQSEREMSPGAAPRYVFGPNWEDPRPRAAVRLAQAEGGGTAPPADALLQAHHQAAEFAKASESDFEWANQRLGDSATGAEFEVGYVTMHMAMAARDASAADIRSSVTACADHAAQAIAFSWEREEKGEKLKAEKCAQARLIREMSLLRKNRH